MSGIHRNLGTHISKVRSVRLDVWPDDLVERMKETGNDLANAKWEANVPIACKRPHFNDSYVLREQWIRAKYERQEFVDKEKPLAYVTGMKEGFLHKKGKANNKWAKRWFVMDGVSISYFKQKQDPAPKDTLPVKDVNVTVASEKTGRPYALHISCAGRNYFVSAENGKDIVDWMSAIRAARAKALGIDASRTDFDAVVSRKLSRDFVIEGYLNKIGEMNKAWKRRWCTLDDKTIEYFKDPLDARALGEIRIGSAAEGYQVSEGEAGDVHELTLFVPASGRTFHFSSESKETVQKWVACIRDAIMDCDSLI
eukprot:Opistho-2@95439